MRHDTIGHTTPDQTASRHTSRAAAPAAGATLETIRADLARFNASLELFCRKLGRVLPDISTEINNTYRKASQTMDSLISENPAGPIEITVSALDVSLARIDKHLRDHKAEETRMSKDLEAFRAGMPAAQAAVEEFQRRLDELAALHMLEVSADSALAARQAEDVNDRVRAVAGIIRELAAHQSRLSENIETAAGLRAGIISTVEMHTSQDVNALKDTLGTVIMILKDLIARSNATKVPIQTIMTALQIHDIVRQDTENILAMLERLQVLAEEANHPESDAFRHQALTVSGSLLFDISTIVHDHVQTIARQIEGLHEIIAGVKADKIHLAELLLINTQGRSTLDRALAEIAAMFQDLTERLSILASLGKRRSEMLQASHDLIDELHQISQAALQDSRTLAEACKTHDLHRIASLQASGQNMQSAIAALALPPVQPAPAEDAQTRDAAEECIALIQDDTQALRGSLLEIKHVLVDSIDGINDYANRCMLAVLRFKRRMQRLNLFVARLPDIARTLITLAGLPDETPQTADSSDAELKDLLMLLYNPHIKTVNRPAADHGEDTPLDDGGLTLF